MDPSHNFPPSPRDMYMYRPPQQTNGHNMVQSPSPSRGKPPPVLPERKPETKLSQRTSRSSFNSRGSSSSDMASPPLSPVYSGHGHHPFHQQHAGYPDNNKRFTGHFSAINDEPKSRSHSLTESSMRGRSERDGSPHGKRGNTLTNDVHNFSNVYSSAHDDDEHFSGAYQRIDRNRITSPERSLTGELGYAPAGSFNSGNNLKYSEGIYGQFVEPVSSSTPHRPSLTYVPPPVVPTLQPDIVKSSERGTKNDQHQQKHHQHKAVNNNDTHGASMSPDAASNHHAHHHHHHHCNHHHHHHTHPQHASPSHQHHHVLASTGSPLASPKLFRASKKSKSKQENIPSPPSIPIPCTPIAQSDKYISNVNSTRTPSPPLPPPPSEIGSSSRSRSSKKGIEPNSSSPLSANTPAYTYQHCTQSPSHHGHHNNYHPTTSTDHPPKQLMHNNHHQTKQTPVPAPPPPPPTRMSSTSQLPTNHLQDYNPIPTGVRSPRANSPARIPGAIPHSLKQPSLATLDDLAQVKLRAVTDSSCSNPHSPLVSPVATSDSSSATINVKLRPTPGKFRNIYAEDTSILPPPPPLDDLDELPPPPPPPELLCHDPAPASLEFNSQQRHTAPVPAPFFVHTGEASIDHITPYRVNSTGGESGAGAKAGSASGDGDATNGASSSIDQLILECVANMDMEIPVDIDLTQCPGLIEINKSTPNWKRDMIEKKNQEKIEEYVKKILKEREHEAKWKNVPDWKRKILQKKEEEEGLVTNPPQEDKPSTGKKTKKKAPLPPPKETKEDALSKSKNDLVPAALSIDPEELAAMPPWKRELLFKRDKVPVTFSNEFNPEDENENVPTS